MAVVYHWKHGWIPLDHAAALSKAKGNHTLAAKMLADAPAAHGIQSRQDVAKAVRDLPNVPDGHRDAAVAHLRMAAASHDSTDLLPGKHRATSPQVEYRQGRTPTSVTAHINGERVGELAWHERDGHIVWISVYDEKHRRKGIASGMLKKALQMDPRVRHNRSGSDALTDLGRKFADATPIKRRSR